MKSLKNFSIFVFLFVLISLSVNAAQLMASSYSVTDNQDVNCTYQGAQSAVYNYRFYWYENGATTPSFSSVDTAQPYNRAPVSTLPASVSTPGNWKCAVFFIDNYNQEHQLDILTDNIVITPVSGSFNGVAAITPANPDDNQNLIGTYQGAQSPAYNYELDWYKDGSTTPYKTTIDTAAPYNRDPVSTISAAETSVGDVWVLKVFFIDNSGARYMISQTSAQITAPTSLLNVTITANPMVGIAPLNVVFSAAVTGGSGSYNYGWDFNNDGSIEMISASPSWTFAQGTYTVNLTVTDSVTGASGHDSITITANSPSVLTINAAANPNTGNAPLSVSFTSNAAGGTSPYTYNWDFNNDGIIDSNLQNPGHAYAAAGNYNARINISDSNGQTAQMILPITVNQPALALTASAIPNSGNVPLAVAFTATVSGGSSPYTYNWDFNNDGIVDTHVQNPGYTYLAAGNYNARINVTDSSGLSAQMILPVTATQNGANNIVFTTTTLPDATVDENYSATISATSNGTVTYSLLSDAQSGMSINSATGQFKWTPAGTGTFTFTVRATDSTNLWSLDRTFQIHVNAASSVSDENDLFIDSIQFDSDNVNQGDTLSAYITLENEGASRFKDLQVTMYLDDYAISQNTNTFNLDSHQKLTRQIDLDLPSKVTSGYYNIRFVIKNDDISVTKYREIYINGQSQGAQGTVTPNNSVVISPTITSYETGNAQPKINWLGIWFMILLFLLLLALVIYLTREALKEKEDEQQESKEPEFKFDALDNSYI